MVNMHGGVGKRRETGERTREDEDKHDAQRWHKRTTSSLASTTASTSTTTTTTTSVNKRGKACGREERGKDRKSNGRMDLYDIQESEKGVLGNKKKAADVCLCTVGGAITTFSEQIHSLQTI
jgi:hypothetical protein